jgi:hypothetical protein
MMYQKKKEKRKKITIFFTKIKCLESTLVDAQMFVVCQETYMYIIFKYIFITRGIIKYLDFFICLCKLNTMFIVPNIIPKFPLKITCK